MSTSYHVRSDIQSGDGQDAYAESGKLAAGITALGVEFEDYHRPQGQAHIFGFDYNGRPRGLARFTVPASVMDDIAAQWLAIRRGEVEPVASPF